MENKDIYERDNSIYDVYISVFPTKDDAGNILDFSAFSQCTSKTVHIIILLWTVMYRY